MQFITFEGCEGAGKSTQAKLLADSFEKAGYKVALTREPGGTKTAELIRDIMLNHHDISIKPITELLLANAARYEHVQDVILPAIKDGKIVICDRFVDSTMAYQGFAHKLGKKLPAILHNLIFPNIAPELTFILDIDPIIGVRRSSEAYNENRFEKMAIDFHERTRTGFSEIAKNAPERCVLLDATNSINSIHNDIINAINERTKFKLQIM